MSRPRGSSISRQLPKSTQRRRDPWEASGSNLHRKKVSSACVACQVKKLKCDGVLPCNRCVAQHLDCKFDLATDGRRRPALKRKQDELTEDRELLLQLIERLRSASDKHLNELLLVIQSGASISQIRRCVDGQLQGDSPEGGLPTPPLIEIRTLLGKFQHDPVLNRRRVLDAKRLADIPLFQVPASPWTTVTNDPDLVSHILSCWLTWRQPDIHVVDVELFIHAMQVGDVSSEYCSPLLVNAMLAEGCHYSDWPEAAWEGGSVSSLSDHFYREAKRLLDVEEGRVSLTNLQALSVLTGCTILMGKDRVSSVYLSQMASLASEMSARRPASPGESEDFNNSVSIALWSAYNVAATFGLALGRAPAMVAPVPEIRKVDWEEETSTWSAYPSQQWAVQGHLQCVLHAQNGLLRVTHQAAELMFHDRASINHAELEERVFGLHQTLESWAESMPRCIKLIENGLPHLISIHIHYHWIIVALFSYLMEDSETTRAPDSEPSSHSRAKEVAFASALRISQLIDHHVSFWPKLPMPPMSLQGAAIATYTLMEDPEPLANCEALVKCSLCIRYFALHCPFGKGILRSIQIMADEKRLKMPEELYALFRDLEQKIWHKEQAETFSSRYPNFAYLIRQDPSHENDEFELDKILKKWDDISLADQGNQRHPESALNDKVKIQHDDD